MEAVIAAHLAGLLTTVIVILAVQFLIIAGLLASLLWTRNVKDGAFQTMFAEWQNERTEFFQHLLESRKADQEDARARTESGLTREKWMADWLNLMLAQSARDGVTPLAKPGANT